MTFMTLLATFLTAILAMIAALHFYWALGGLWPCETERELIDTVIGNPRMNRMPPAWLTVAVSVLLTGLALWPLVLAPVAVHLVGAGLTWWASMAAATVFLLRGLGGYAPAWMQGHQSEPFATYDRRYYSPLCILLGLGYAAFTLGGPI